MGFYATDTRYYDPEIGRFLNADSIIVGSAENILGYNIYVYCFNNPINMEDNTGHWPKLSTIFATVATADISSKNGKGEDYMQAACDYLFNRAEKWVINIFE